MSKKSYDIIVIGGGIVGCAVAKAITESYRARVAVLEAEDRTAAHQTGHNSGVIHSGLYYAPGSLKAEHCARGREALYRFVSMRDIPHEQCGKLVVATHPAELSRLDLLERRGQANGLKGLKRIGPEEIREREPHIRGIAGLLVPETGIVDFEAVTDAYADAFRKHGGELHLNTRFLKAVEQSKELIIETSGGTFHTQGMINCAGLESDRVASRSGVDPGLRIVPFRGEYCEIVPERSHLVNHLVYPVPDPRFPFLGVHFTRVVRGGVEAGPNAVLALKREGYRWSDVSLRDIASYLFYLGFWKMALRFGRIGLGEVYRSLSRRGFVKALNRLMPELTPRDVTRGGAGVRAQALTRDGRLSDDFEFKETSRMIHVLNAPSPAATASLAIAETVATRAAQRFGLQRK